MLLDVKQFSQSHPQAVTVVEFSMDNIFVASGSQDSEVRIWDVRKLQCLHTFKHHVGKVNCITFSPDSRWLFTGADDGICAAVDIAEGKVINVFRNDGLVFFDVVMLFFCF
jgi:katanin p80 WD40 repeat-containing subunit B1